MHGRTGVQAPAAHRPHTRSQSTRKKHPAGPCGGSRRAWWISSRLHTRHHTFTAPPSIHLNSLCQAQAYDCCIRSLALTRTYPAHMARAQLLVLLVVCGLAAASAFPYLFVNEYAKTCTSHPEKAHAGHGAPTADRTPVYALRDSKNALVRVACPGGKYQLTITFPEPRNALVTTTVGTLAGGALNTKGACPNRALTIRGPGKGGRVATMQLPWSVPCNAKGKAVVVVTSAKGSMGAFRTSTTEVTIGARPVCPALC